MVFIRGETLSAHSACPQKIPGWIALIPEKFSVNKLVCKKINSRNCVGGLCHFSFSNFTFGYHSFNLKKLKMQSIFELACRRKFSGEQ